MEYVPNVLSLSRIPLSVMLFVFAMNEHWGWAATCMIVALITDGLDGAIARRYNVQSELGGKYLETYCDLALAAGVVGGLYVGRYWPLWVPIALFTIQVLLEISHKTPFTRLKRHTYYLHPLFFVTVVFMSGYILLALALEEPGWVWQYPALTLYVLAWAAVAYAKESRWMVWFRGPQPVP